MRTCEQESFGFAEVDLFENLLASCCLLLQELVVVLRCIAEVKAK